MDIIRQEPKRRYTPMARLRSIHAGYFEAIAVTDLAHAGTEGLGVTTAACISRANRRLGIPSRALTGMLGAATVALDS